MIGLSNWELDAAKMNRAVHASRLPLSIVDLQDTADSLLAYLSKFSEVTKITRILSENFYNYMKKC